MSTDARRHMAAAHEAAHAVASYLLGIDLAKVEIDSADGSFTRVAKSSRPVLSDPTSVFDYAIVLLSGGAYLRSCGIKRSQDDSDFPKAVWLLQNGTESKAAARAGFSVCLEATTKLVESDRFQTLAARLTPVLAKELWHWGPDVLRFLRENDPERPSRSTSNTGASSRRETHSWPPTAPVSAIHHDDGTVTLYSLGRLIVSRGSPDEVERLSREILG